jgi:hypothetical protein
MFAFCHAFALICCVCDFIVKLKSERVKQLVSIVSLFEPGDSCIECSGICPQGVRDRRVQEVITFVLSPQECRI